MPPLLPAHLDVDGEYIRRFIERHRAKVDRSEGLLACWPWTGARNRNGYGTLRGSRLHIGETGIRWIYQAHRVALAIETCPDDQTIFQFMDSTQARLEAAHARVCRTRLCCNALHLSWKSHRQNLLDIVVTGGQLGVSHDKGRRVTA